MEHYEESVQAFTPTVPYILEKTMENGAHANVQQSKFGGNGANGRSEGPIDQILVQFV